MVSGSDSRIQHDGEPSLDSAYLTHFFEHSRETISHCTGSDGSAPLQPSFFPPNGYWTSAEKDAFFHGLVIHSRLRPDLIAAEIKTKSEVDVCVYLDLLAEAGARSTSAVDDTANFVVLPRKDFPAAVEVSDEWVALEERNTSAIIRAESEQADNERQQQRDEAIRLAKNRIRARKGQARTAANERDRDGEKRRKVEFAQWLETKTAEWELEDLLGVLDSTALLALDRIVREDELPYFSQSSSSSQQTKPDRPQAQSSHANASSSVKGIRIEQVQVSAAASSSSGSSESIIDPALLAISGPQQELRPAPIISPIPASAPFQPNTPPFQPAPLPNVDDPPTHSTTPPPTLDAFAARPAGDAEHVVEGDELAKLSPASRRRHLKKLYMRRKRAQATGSDVVETVYRLKPGRKGKFKATNLAGSSMTAAANIQSSVTGSSSQPQSIAGSSSFEGSMAKGDPPEASTQEELAGHSTEHNRVRSSVSGPTRPYKTSARMAEVGLDAKWLYNEGLALFHLNAFHKLMRYFAFHVP